VQKSADIARMKVHPEPLGDDPLEVDPSPAHDAELCANLGDGVDQAADISWFATSIPSWNFTPRTTFGN